MFTGIVEEIGKVIFIEHGSKSAILSIKAEKIMSDINIGDSIAVNGVCLTVTNYSKDSFLVDIMYETLERSSLASLKSGIDVNLERAMPFNGRFGGHIVSGHIDGIGEIIEIKKYDNAIWYKISTKDKILRYIVEKGSIAIDGISLTVAKLGDKDFSVSIIPHTSKNTILNQKNIGDKVNLENDCIGKYIEKFLTIDNSKNSKESSINMDFLLKNGF